MNADSLFVVDDEESIRDAISMALEDDYTVRTFASAEAALAVVEASPPDLILLDIGLPGMNGIEALRAFKEFGPHLPVVMITAYEDIQTVIAAMKLGAYDYVVKPLHLDGLAVTIRNALETVRLHREVRDLQAQVLQENLPYFVSASDAIQDVMGLIAKVAKSPDTPILILGETGTGKELIARAIHYQSPNYKAPLVTVNCAAIPRDLIESELFGYEKGAFSGASASGKKGLIEAASEGTLFLDEVGDLSPEAQAKLLRFLEQGEFYRVGGTHKLSVRTRVVSATNKDIEQMTADGRFRNDLYFRLGVIKVQVPSLNERREDILPLANYFLSQFNRKFDRGFEAISRPAEKLLLTHRWTGNVRELKNLIERAVLTGTEPEITSEAMGFEKKALQIAAIGRPAGQFLAPIPPEGLDFSALQDEVERYYLDAAYRLADGNESQAARLLGLNHHTFRYRRKKLQRR